MKAFKVLGSGCANCVNTAKLIEKIAAERGVDVSVEKVTDLETIMNYGVMSTPGVVMDEEVVHAGGIPNYETIVSWLD
ncbi:thioredoxin family protein [Vibrio cholerae]|uniref:thioredoxin family protein n=1 Tax=Vibrio cholerae TaxID=666 RepID=UPI001584304D|nr:thioredoxin family protein [Vibrio cholerae]EGR1127114.1 thioredoxin family protein [Vibrio cholerae]EGR2040641.1 thioredoxin family protein [Vibrio cholerae]EGR2064455.1 thioredoxin family protein [Vibrio cholerae]EGR2115598.1 thioredoxin family protein [Vibrio cholerae]EGR2121035.1 thioredoxin family protein [Vibrio cholerae]